MAVYKLGIDETGRFALNDSLDDSFVCGVLTCVSENTLIDAYKMVYKKIMNVNVVPENFLAQLHYTKHHSASDKEVYKEKLLPLISNVFISEGRPSLFANNQNWWLIAVSMVISSALKSQFLQEGDSLFVDIDERDPITWGITCDIDDNLIDQKAELNFLKLQKDAIQKEISFPNYHYYLLLQIKLFVSDIARERKIDIKIRFVSDSKSYYVNFADIVCGLCRKNRVVIEQMTRCYCSHFMSGNDPIQLKKTNPLAAISTVFQEICNDYLENISIVSKTLLKRMRSTENYAFIWSMFYDLIKTKILSRKNRENQLMSIKPLVDVFLFEFFKVNNSGSIELLSGETKLEILILIAEYYSHIGSTELPFNEIEFFDLLKYNGKNAETRLLRRWEKYISYMLRKAQIDFNGYNFDDANERFSKLWEHQETILNQLKLFSADGNNKTLKDEPTAAICGTLAQSYAYKGELDAAIEYFEMSREYTMRSSAQTNSFLLTIYQRKKDIDKMRECFIAQVGKTPEEYYEAQDFDDTWKLTSYCRLRATELYVNNCTELKGEYYFEKINCKGEYPLPLAQKWEAIALYMEDKDENKAKVENLFTLAIESLMDESNGFTIRTLVLPIIQCYGFVNPQNKFHSGYNSFLEKTLLRESDVFRYYVERNSPRLLKISNKRDFTLWERALMLPFIYS